MATTAPVLIDDLLQVLAVHLASVLGDHDGDATPDAVARALQPARQAIGALKQNDPDAAVRVAAGLYLPASEVVQMLKLEEFVDADGDQLAELFVESVLRLWKHGPLVAA
jgi:hypothetical protein